MEKELNIQEYMTDGVRRIVADSLKAVVRNPKETVFMLKFAKSAERKNRQRQKLMDQGENVPPFLICSVTRACNMHCEGCYSRYNETIREKETGGQLSSAEWLELFREADSLGISYILLAGGEPLLRRDVIKKAGEIPDIIFPIFTNGVYIDEEYFDLFERKRNLIPVLSIEGGRDTTNQRRGEGVYEKQIENMNTFKDKDLVYGASVTVTSGNLEEVTGDEFIDDLAGRGCRVLIYVEYVPVEAEAAQLALSEDQQQYLLERTEQLRRQREDIVFVSFPGDEKGSGGCIAAGRGFFHINAHGGAEPCPFSPYSDINVRDASLREALKSPLFLALQEGDYLKDDHEGGCVLFAKRQEVEQILKKM